MQVIEIINRVIAETGRPDLAEMIELTVTSCIRQVHSKALFKRDLVEEVIKVPDPSNLIRLTLPPRFRRFRDVVITNNYGQSMHPCKNVNPSQILARPAQSEAKPNYYVAGTTYTVSGGTTHLLPITYLYTSYYTTPPLESKATATWLTELYPETIINYTLFKIHGKVGNDKKASQAYILYEAQFTDIIEDQEVD